MTDNVAVTAGSGTTIAADEVTDGTLGTVKVQYVKLMDGTLDGTAKAAVNANGLKVDGSAVTQPISGTISAKMQDGSGNGLASDLRGTRQSLAVQVVDASGNQITTFGGAGGTASNFASAFPTAGTAIGAKNGANMVNLVADASNNLNVNIAATSGTLTVQPGNTANTTAWKVQLYDGTNALPILAASSGAPAASAPALAVSVRDANANGQAVSSNSAPVVFASDQTIANKAVTQSSGITDTRVDSVATSPAPGVSLKASAGNVFSIDVYNVAAYDVFLKLYNKASAPTVGTDTPVWTIPIKTGSGFSRDFPRGRNFATGIAYAITKLQADTDTTAVAAHDLTGTIGWI